jgi:hypothetical protein
MGIQWIIVQVNILSPLTSRQNWNVRMVKNKTNFRIGPTIGPKSIIQINPVFQKIYIRTSASPCTLHRKFEANIPRNETAWHCSQFLYSCAMSDWYIPTIGLPILLYCLRGLIVGIYKLLTYKHECRNWDRGRAVSFLGIFVSNFRYNAFAV